MGKATVKIRRNAPSEALPRKGLYPIKGIFLELYENIMINIKLKFGNYKHFPNTLKDYY